jgi:Fic family protein
MRPYQPEKLPLKNLDWAAFVRYIGPANRAIARYDGMLQAVLNPELLLSPLMVQEAVMSSQIEGTQATLEEVMAFEGAGQSPKEESKRNDIQEIINYRSAMRAAIDEMNKRPVNLNLLHKMHYILLDSVRGRDKARGEFRKTQNYIGKPGTPIEQAKFIPPDPLTVMEHMSNLEKYVHYEEQDALVQLAVIHAQFELIHPYVDGNGRLGRIIIPLILYGKKVLSSPMFYLSAYLETHREEYYERLNAISRERDWTGWITFFLKAVIEQAKRAVWLN